VTRAAPAQFFRTASAAPRFHTRAAAADDFVHADSSNFKALKPHRTLTNFDFDRKENNR
jgi:hypothetical protein